MVKRRNVDPEVAHQRAKKAAAARWRKAGSRKAAGETSRRTNQERWEREVDPDGVLSEAVRRELADEAMRAFMRRASLVAQVNRARRMAAQDKLRELTAAVESAEAARASPDAEDDPAA